MRTNMSLTHSLLRSIGLLCITGLMALNYATAQPAPEYEPKVGQQGKDVI